MPRLNLLLFWGCPTYRDTPTFIELAMDELLRVALRSTLSRAHQTHRFDRLLVITNDPQIIKSSELEAEILLMPRPGEIFQFGRALQQVITQAGIGLDEAIIYLGAGAGALLSDVEWTALLDTVQNNPRSVTANNYFSADLVGWQPAQAISWVEQAALDGGDNNLAWGLCRQAGLTWRTFLPANTRTFGTQFDLDTPSDAAILKLWLSRQTETKWSLLHQFLQQTTAFDAMPASRVLEALSDFNQEVLVSGRISGQTHRLLESKSWGQTRIISEERGMRASGREEAGRVVSLLGGLLQNLGAQPFLAEFLPLICQAAILDSRVLFAHQRLKPSRRDRFNSDALQSEFVHDSVVRAFTETTQATIINQNIPILLGGHTVVAGGLLLLLDLVPPKPYDGFYSPAHVI